MLNRELISYVFKKQAIIILLLIKAKYVAFNLIIQKAI